MASFHSSARLMRSGPKRRRLSSDVPTNLHITDFSLFQGVLSPSQLEIGPSAIDFKQERRCSFDKHLLFMPISIRSPEPEPVLTNCQLTKITFDWNRRQAIFNRRQPFSVPHAFAGPAQYFQFILASAAARVPLEIEGDSSQWWTRWDTYHVEAQCGPDVDQP